MAAKYVARTVSRSAPGSHPSTTAGSRDCTRSASSSNSRWSAAERSSASSCCCCEASAGASPSADARCFPLASRARSSGLSASMAPCSISAPVYRSRPPTRRAASPSCTKPSVASRSSTATSTSWSAPISSPSSATLARASTRLSTIRSLALKPSGGAPRPSREGTTSPHEPSPSAAAPERIAPTTLSRPHRHFKRRSHFNAVRCGAQPPALSPSNSDALLEDRGHAADVVRPEVHGALPVGAQRHVVVARWYLHEGVVHREVTKSHLVRDPVDQRPVGPL